MIRVEGLSRSFGAVRAVDGVAFEAGDGRITGLLGPNGAGKSTTLRILYTVLRPDSGTASIDGVDVVGDPLATRRCIGVLPHGADIYPQLTARENIAYFGRLHGLEGAALDERVESLVGELDMGGYANRRAKGYSQGERIKVALARALVHAPKNLLLDEPTNGLDVMATRALRALILRLRAAGHCILFSSHVMQEVAALCDDIVIVDKGRVVAAGTPEALQGAVRVRDARGRLRRRDRRLAGTRMISTIRTVMQKELRESLRDRRTLVNSLLIGPILAPLFFILILKLALARSVSTEDEPAPVTVVNAAAAPNFVQQLRERGLEVSLREGTEADIRRWIADQNDLVVICRPAGLRRALHARASPRPCRCTPTARTPRPASTRRACARRSPATRRWSGALRLQARGVSPTVIQPVVIDDIDVSTPSARATLMLGMLSYVILLATLMGGLYLAIDATAGERERGSLESLLTLPVVREHLIYGKIAATTVMMLVSLALVATSVSFSLKALPLETFGMTANFGPGVVWRVFLAVAPFALVAASILTVVASFTRTYKEAQSWLGLVLIVPTVPIAIASVLDVAPRASLMLVPSLSQHLLIQGLIRGEPLPVAWALLATASCLALGLALAWLAGRLYRREAILG